ncbi:hypothetical protein F4809DRAFT_617270 [Biscogniauxia mediterranea]|nr:hypothetical protein F4809DRAFT_617270 [Biscogniauxia mediterranea]
MPSVDVALKLQHMTFFITLCWFILPSHSSGGVLAASTVFSAAAVMGAGTLCVVSMGSVSDLAYRSTLLRYLTNEEISTPSGIRIQTSRYNVTRD